MCFGINKITSLSQRRIKYTLTTKPQHQPIKLPGISVILCLNQSSYISFIQLYEFSISYNKSKSWNYNKTYEIIGFENPDDV